MKRKTFSFLAFSLMLCLLISCTINNSISSPKEVVEQISETSQNQQYGSTTFYESFSYINNISDSFSPISEDDPTYFDNLPQDYYGLEGYPYTEIHEQGLLVFFDLSFYSDYNSNLITYIGVDETSFYQPVISFSVSASIDFLADLEDVVGQNMTELLKVAGMPTFLGKESNYSLDFVMNGMKVVRASFQRTKDSGWKRNYIVTSIETFSTHEYMLNEIVDESKTVRTYKSRANKFKSLDEHPCISDVLRILGKANRQDPNDSEIYEWDVNDGTTIRGRIVQAYGVCRHNHRHYDSENELNYMLEGYEVIHSIVDNPF